MDNPQILDRTMYYDFRRNGTLRLMDWNVVNTSQGTCVEPAFVNEMYGPSIDIDLDEIAPNRILQFPEALFFSTFGTGGNQTTVNYNSQ